MSGVDATSFPDVEAAVIAVVKAAMPTLFASNTTPAPIPVKAVIVGFSGGGRRDWGEASVNVGFNVYAATEAECRALTIDVQDALAKASNNLIARVAVPAGGGTSIPRQSPPFQRYFAATVYLRGQSVLGT